MDGSLVAREAGGSREESVTKQRGRQHDWDRCGDVALDVAAPAG